MAKILGRLTDHLASPRGIHIGMFLAWAFGQGMAREVHREDSAKEPEQLAKREITGLDFLIEAGDEKFWEMDLDQRGNAFTIDYYYDANSAFAKRHGSYLDDYCHVFNRHAADHGFEYPSIYHVENTWEKFRTAEAGARPAFRTMAAMVGRRRGDPMQGALMSQVKHNARDNSSPRVPA